MTNYQAKLLSGSLLLSASALCFALNSHEPVAGILLLFVGLFVFPFGNPK